ncbi:MAG: guanylate kinase [Myxococcota bacterium]|nr:guanylate kinase [Myxococcota bacterium]
MSRHGIPFVVAAPSGTGKTTVCRRVVAADDALEFSVSHTTRAPRAGEQDGVHYHFVAPSRFEALVGEGAFLEWAEYNGNRYGTSWQAIEEPLAQGRDVVLEIEVQGAAQVRERRSDARFIFLLPPSMAALERRLRERGTDAEREVNARLALARQELRAALRFDYAVVNDTLDRCVDEVREVVQGEREGRTEGLRRRFDPQAALAHLEPDAAG